MIIIFENGDVIKQPQSLGALTSKCVKVQAILLTPDCCDLLDSPTTILKYLGGNQKVQVSQIADALQLYDNKP